MFPPKIPRSRLGFGSFHRGRPSNGVLDLSQQQFLGDRLPDEPAGTHPGSARLEPLRVATGDDDVFGVVLRVMATQPFNHVHTVPSMFSGSIDINDDQVRPFQTDGLHGFSGATHNGHAMACHLDDLSHRQECGYIL